MALGAYTPPWLDVNPMQFTQAAESGSRIGLQKAAQREQAREAAARIALANSELEQRKSEAEQRMVQAQMERDLQMKQLAQRQNESDEQHAYRLAALGIDRDKLLFEQARLKKPQVVHTAQGMVGVVDDNGNFKLLREPDLRATTSQKRIVRGPDGSQSVYDMASGQITPIIPGTTKGEKVGSISIPISSTSDDRTTFDLTREQVGEIGKLIKPTTTLVPGRDTRTGLRKFFHIGPEPEMQKITTPGESPDIGKILEVISRKPQQLPQQQTQQSAAPQQQQQPVKVGSSPHYEGEIVVKRLQNGTMEKYVIQNGRPVPMANLTPSSSGTDDDSEIDITTLTGE